MAAAMIGSGLVMLVTGIFVKPAGEGVGWSYFWGFSENSTLLGKAIYITGVIAMIAGIYRIAN